MKRLLERRIWGFLLVGLVLIAWETASTTRLVNPFYFPPVHRVAMSLAATIADGRLPAAVLASLGRGLAGYLIATLLGGLLGLLAGYHVAIRHLIEPLVEMLRPLPSSAIIPVAILLFGIDLSMKVFIVAWACFFPILINTTDGVRAIPPALIETARNLGLSYFRILFTVVLPAASPSLFTGLRVSLAIMLILTVIAEMVAGNSGVGYILLEAERTFRIAEMYAFIVALAAVGYLLNRLFLVIDRRALGWHHAMHRLPTP